MATASCTLAFFSVASGSPKSANRFGPASLTSVFCFERLFIVPFGCFQSVFYFAHIRQWGLNPTPGFLLEYVKHIHGFFEAHGIYRPVGISGVVLQKFVHPWPTALPGFH